MKANIITNAGPVAAVPGGIYEGIDYHGEPPWDKAMRAGWRKLDKDDLPNAPTGKAVRATYIQDPTREDYAVGVYEYVDIPEPTPDRFPNGIDASLLVLDAPDGKGIGYVADGEGVLVPVVYAHESPYDMAALQAKIATAREAAAKAKSDRVTEAKTISADAGKANSVAALRSQVQALTALVEKLIGGGQ